jgi:hypothetical protein
MPEVKPESSRLVRAIHSLIAISVVAYFWLVFLPWLADRPVVRQHVDFLNDRRINASAMFYTELDPQ